MTPIKPPLLSLLSTLSLCKLHLSFLSIALRFYPTGGTCRDKLHHGLETVLPLAPTTGTRIRRRHFLHRRGYPPPGSFHNIWDGNVDFGHTRVYFA